ncbi:MAG: DUF3137 domain-containing protein [Wujia sp.]
METNFQTGEALKRLNELHDKAKSTGILAIGWVVICLLAFPFTAGMSMFGMMAGAFIYLIPFLRWQREYKRIYKEVFMPGLLQETFDEVDYRWEVGFDNERIRNFALVAMGNRVHSEDYLSASYKGIHFEQADVTIKNHTGSGKNSHTVTYFVGRMFVFQCPDKRVLSTQIFSEHFAYRGKVDNGWKHKKVKLESIDFNKKFDVLSADEHDAFYILTPQMMERIDDLDSQFGSVAMRFCGSELYVAVSSSRNAFDGNISKEIDYLTEKELIRNDLQVIIDIINTLAIADTEE